MTDIDRIRIEQNKFQVAWVRLEHPDHSGIREILGLCHDAHPDFFKRVNQVIESSDDAIVLRERVKADTVATRLFRTCYSLRIHYMNCVGLPAAHQDDTLFLPEGRTVNVDMHGSEIAELTKDEYVSFYANLIYDRVRNIQSVTFSNRFELATKLESNYLRILPYRHRVQRLFHAVRESNVLNYAKQYPDAHFIIPWGANHTTNFLLDLSYDGWEIKDFCYETVRELTHLGEDVLSEARVQQAAFNARRGI